jgi:hypothetical protein
MLQVQKETVRNCVHISYKVTTAESVPKHLDGETSCEATVIKMNVVIHGLKKTVDLLEIDSGMLLLGTVMDCHISTSEKNIC